jgi:hypothetical protein
VQAENNAKDQTKALPMAGEKRLGKGPVPKKPERYLSAQQVNVMTILRKFGWKLVCIRRPANHDVTTIFHNRREGTVGILGKDGILRISDSLKIRKVPL